MSKPTFRQAALNALSSPEELNNVLVVTRPGTWVALVAIVIIVLATLIWSVVGVIPTTVEARGILARPGGLQSVAALGNGILKNVVVSENQRVKVGDTIAIVDVPDLALQLENAHQAVREADSMYRKLIATNNKVTKLERAAGPSEKKSDALAAQAAQQRLENSQQMAESTKMLLDKGLVTRNEYHSKLDAVLKAQEDLLRLRASELNGSKQQTQVEFQREQELLRVEAQLTAAIRSTRELALRYQQASTVTATCAGRVTQISVAEGMPVTSGETVAMIEADSGVVASASEMLVAIFVPPALGKKVKPGMVVNVMPTSVEAAEFGSMTARARWISDYPLDASGVRRFISNEGVMNYFGSSQEPPIGVLAILDVDPNNPSGYRWTSGRGPDVRITTGTVCNCNIVVDENPPIALLLPWLKRTLGLDS
jgi:HlyD family secretion protein